MAPLFDEIGADKLRQVLEDFYDRVFDDVMIGFLFVGKDKRRLIEKEWEFTANLLGAGVAYTGRSMPEAHRASPILGGHFERRQKLLRDVLEAHNVAAEVRDAWLDHADRLRPTITADKGTECNHAATEMPDNGGD